MKEFFKQCLEELKLRSGIDQLHWLRQECESQQEFDRKKGILIDGMVMAAQKFDYIPEFEQQKYITRMMIEDQNYDGLNSRVIWRWLDLHKDKHTTFSKISEEEMTPAPKEVADKYIAEIQANIAKIGNPMDKLESMRGLPEIAKKESDRKKFVVGLTCISCEGTGQSVIPEMPGTCDICEGTGQIDRAEVYAVSLEEARKAYLATFE